MSNFANFPHEALLEIFHDVPNDLLVTLLEIPEIETPVLNSLYSTIKIGGNVHDVALGPVLDENKIPMLKSTREYLNFLEDHPTIKPKKLIFTEPLDLLLFAREFPENLKGIEVELAVPILGNYEEEMKFFRDEYIKESFPISSLSYNNMDFFDDNDGLEFFKNLKSVSVPEVIRSGSRSHEYSDHNVKMFSAKRFPKLSSLSDSHFNNFDEVEGEFPDQVEKLSCCMKLTEYDSDIDGEDEDEEGEYGMSDFGMGFSENLVELKIVLRNQNGGDLALVINELSKLQKLTTSSLTRGSTGFRLELPSGVKYLDTEMFHIGAACLKEDCPGLIQLKISDTEGNGCLLPSLVRDLPPTLESLQIPQMAFKFWPLKEPGEKRQKFETDLHHPVLELPESLKELVILGGGESQDEEYFLDFSLNKLDNLKKLSISDVSNFSILGNIPANITGLYLKNSPIVDLNQLEALKRLTKLVLIGDIGTDDFNYKLPSSLKYLEVSNGNLNKLHIEAPNLVELVLTGNEFGNISKANFVIPSALKKLTLDGVDAISMALPEKLQELDLKVKHLDNLNNIPTGLKHLKLDVSERNTNEKLVFPLGLETLKLSSSLTKEGGLDKLNLSELTNLKLLDLKGNHLTELNTTLLPTSLVVLNLKENKLAVSECNFLHLVNLQQLDMSENKSDKEMPRYSGDNSYFGNSIRFVNARGSNLTREDVEVLLTELNSKQQRFEFLDVDKELVPESESQLQARIRKVGCRIRSEKSN